MGARLSAAAMAVADPAKRDGSHASGSTRGRSARRSAKTWLLKGPVNGLPPAYLGKVARP